MEADTGKLRMKGKVGVLLGKQVEAGADPFRKAEEGSEGNWGSWRRTSGG